MRSNIVVFALACVLSVVITSAARAHGVPTQAFVDGANRLYNPTLVTYTEHDSQVTVTDTTIRGTIAFIPDLGTFPAGRQLTVEASGSGQHTAALMYWDGANLLPSPTSVQLQRTGILQSISPTDAHVAIGTLPAYNGLPGGHSSLNMLLPLGSPSGLYAVGLRIESFGSPNFGKSETFWAVINNGLTEPDDIAAGVAAIQSAVPEPSSLALLALGAFPLAWLRWRRRAARA